MALVNTKCPNCGGEIQLDDERQSGFCLYCGSQIDVKQALSQNVINLTGSEEDVNNWKSAYDTYLKVFEFGKAEEILDKLFQARPDDPDTKRRYNELKDVKKMKINQNGMLVRFYDHLKGTTKVIIPSGVISIGYEAFASCSHIKEIVIAEEVNSIGVRAFGWCASLEKITIPEGVTSISESLFYECSSLKEINLPKSVSSIGKFAFNGCASLEKITIPESVTSIGINAFYNCRSLTEITIPEKVTYIENPLFTGCERLKVVNVPKVSIFNGTAIILESQWIKFEKLSHEINSLQAQRWKQAEIYRENRNWYDQNIFVRGSIEKKAKQSKAELDKLHSEISLLEKEKSDLFEKFKIYRNN